MLANDLVVFSALLVAVLFIGDLMFSAWSNPTGMKATRDALERDLRTGSVLSALYDAACMAILLALYVLFWVGYHIKSVFGFDKR